MAFYCTTSSRRSATGDSYAGSLANRMRYPLQVAAAIRNVWPRHKTLSMRITGTDWVDGGITRSIEQREIDCVTHLAVSTVAGVRRSQS